MYLNFRSVSVMVPAVSVWRPGKFDLSQYFLMYYSTLPQWVVSAYCAWIEICKKLLLCNAHGQVQDLFSCFLHRHMAGIDWWPSRPNFLRKYAAGNRSWHFLIRQWWASTVSHFLPQANSGQIQISYVELQCCKLKTSERPIHTIGQCPLTRASGLLDDKLTAFAS